MQALITAAQPTLRTPISRGPLPPNMHRMKFQYGNVLVESFVAFQHKAYWDNLTQFTVHLLYLSVFTLRGPGGRTRKVNVPHSTVFTSLRVDLTMFKLSLPCTIYGANFGPFSAEFIVHLLYLSVFTLRGRPPGLTFGSPCT